MDPSAVQRALGELAARHAEFVGFAARRMSDQAAAEDLVQGVLARAIERLPLVRDERAVVAWFYRALRNAIVDAHRRRGAEERAVAAAVEELDAHIAGFELARPGVCRCVLRVAESLKPEYLAALRAMEVEGDAVKTFAADHGISSSNAAVRLFRAREALRRGVIETCGACAEGGCVECICEASGAGAEMGCHGHSGPAAPRSEQR
jgi:RNA polymerase sigma-70 factor (ECF subfamily)